MYHEIWNHPNKYSFPIRIVQNWNSLPGTLRCENGNGRENVALKVNSPFFNLHRDFSNWLCQINANSPGVEFLRALFNFRKRKKVHCCLVTSSITREIRHFHIVVVHRKARKCTKKCDASAKLLFCLLNLLIFWRSGCRHRRQILRFLLLRTDWTV